jgi:hypothetical protein
VKEFLKPTPGWGTFVRLDLDVPHLRSLLRMGYLCPSGLGCTTFAQPPPNCRRPSKLSPPP